MSATPETGGTHTVNAVTVHKQGGEATGVTVSWRTHTDAPGAPLHVTQFTVLKDGRMDMAHDGESFPKKIWDAADTALRQHQVARAREEDGPSRRQGRGISW